MASSFFVLDESKAPYYEINWSKAEKEPSAEDIDALIQIHLYLLKSHHTRIVLQYNIGQIRFLRSEQRIQIGKFNKEYYNEIKKKVSAVGFVIDTIIGKLILGGIFLVQTPPYPYIIDKNPDEVKAFLVPYISKG